MLENVTVAAAPKATAETGAVGVALKLDAIWVGGSAFRSIDTRGASSSSSSFVAVTIRRARVSSESLSDVNDAKPLKSLSSLSLPNHE